jgi:glycosyltransferase involved in cell wall biosynthesis
MHIREDETNLALPLKSVTVAIPTFNRLNLLKRSIESVLAQHYPHVEIIISDNASTDGTSKYLQTLRDPRIKILSNNENIGMVANWDRCVRAASGTYFLLLSDDDALNGDDALEKFISGFSGVDALSVGVVFSDVVLENFEQNSNDDVAPEKTLYGAEELILSFLSQRVFMCPCGTLFRTSDLLELGGYASFGARLSMDACALISIGLKYGKILRISEPLAIYRVHRNGHSLFSNSSIEDWIVEFKAIRAAASNRQKQMTQQEFQRIQCAMDEAWSRIPLEYIFNKFKHDINYGLISAFTDIALFWRNIFTLSNIYFVLKKLFGLMVKIIDIGVKVKFGLK